MNYQNKMEMHNWKVVTITNPRGDLILHFQPEAIL